MGLKRIAAKLFILLHLEKKSISSRNPHLTWENVTEIQGCSNYITHFVKSHLFTFDIKRLIN